MLYIIMNIDWGMSRFERLIYVLTEYNYHILGDLRIWEGDFKLLTAQLADSQIVSCLYQTSLVVSCSELRGKGKYN